MDGFKNWIQQQESNARQRAALNPGIPAQAGLVFSKTPYTQIAFCKKIKQPGVKLDNMTTTDVCGTGKNGAKKVKDVK